ncbi:hypothetical protein [Paenisporosarcina antarctica]|uniref:Uncharacterized protein n=1 Tax=Paenisporosarcina antarctica TaxID=417367 RepID=A0A4P7A2M3_9BACL|nr:hypothetical protein [Paenisporosarcina antarctica]QBP42689.1 hypothetical protein E2636_16750 [Paenisporosarcina antarctica]
MLYVNKTVGEIIKELYDLWEVEHKTWPDSVNPSHLEFELKKFDPESIEQIRLVSTLCFIVKTGAWETSYSALKRMLPDQEFEDATLEEIKNYFTGIEYIEDKIIFEEYIRNQRNPFILELLSHVMLNSVENNQASAPFNLELQGIHYMHLNSKKQGLDLAAIAKDTLDEEYYLVIGETKNRKSPAQGTLEALSGFNKFDSGKQWPDIRQIMRTVANSFENPDNKISTAISKHILWQKKIIYRLTIEHRSNKPKQGSQFRDFKTNTPNVTYAQFRQCEAISTRRLDVFYDEVSKLLVEFIEKQEEEIIYVG